MVTWRSALNEEKGAEGAIILWLSWDYTALKETINNSRSMSIRHRDESLMYEENQHGDVNLSLGQVIFVLLFLFKT